jgi:hypothetical protein
MILTPEQAYVVLLNLEARSARLRSSHRDGSPHIRMPGLAMARRQFR